MKGPFSLFLLVFPPCEIENMDMLSGRRTMVESEDLSRENCGRSQLGSLGTNSVVAEDDDSDE